jgi:hypothetical protein
MSLDIYGIKRYKFFFNEHPMTRKKGLPLRDLSDPKIVFGLDFQWF